MTFDVFVSNIYQLSLGHSGFIDKVIDKILSITVYCIYIFSGFESPDTPNYIIFGKKLCNMTCLLFMLF